jgi:hypothetical protein
MKYFLFTIIGLLISLFSVNGQDTQSGSSTSIANSLDVYVFPAKEQDKETQDYDEFKCYQWAVEQSGIDPLKGIEVEAAEAGTAPDGSAVRGAARGAAVGAAIGAITGDAGEGAAVGAIAGGAGGLRQGRMRRAGQKKQAEANAAKQEDDMLTKFKNAYAACLEGKGYTVKY